MQNHRNGSQIKTISNKENEGDITQRYDSGVATDDRSELRNVHAELFSRLDRLEYSARRANRVNTSENSPSLQIPRGRKEISFDLPDRASLASTNSNRIIHGPITQTTANGSEADELQKQFNSLKSPLARVILPSSYKLHDSKSGVKREDQPALL